MDAAALEEQDIRPALTQLSEEEELFRNTFREFAEGEVRPRVGEMEKAGKLDPELIKECFGIGLMAIETPEEYGGAGSTFFNAILAIEELARVDASTAVFVDVQNTLSTNAIIHWGNEDLKKKYLPQMAESKVAAYALSEAGSGSDAFALKTRAVDKGDHYEITGQKLWITNGNEAEIFVLFATVDPEAGYKGITAFIVEKDFEGFTVGEKEDKLGIRASSTTEIDSRRLQSAKRKCPRRSRQRLQSFHRNAKRRQNRHRSPNDRHRPRCLRSRACLHKRTRAIWKKPR